MDSDAEDTWPQMNEADGVCGTDAPLIWQILTIYFELITLKRLREI